MPSYNPYLKISGAQFDSSAGSALQAQSIKALQGAFNTVGSTVKDVTAIQAKERKDQLFKGGSALAANGDLEGLNKYIASTPGLDPEQAIKLQSLAKSNIQFAHSQEVYQNQKDDRRVKLEGIAADKEARKGLAEQYVADGAMNGAYDKVGAGTKKALELTPREALIDNLRNSSTQQATTQLNGLGATPQEVAAVDKKLEMQAGLSGMYGNVAGNGLGETSLQVAERVYADNPNSAVAIAELKDAQNKAGVAEASRKLRAGKDARAIAVASGKYQDSLINGKAGSNSSSSNATKEFKSIQKANAVVDKGMRDILKTSGKTPKHAPEVYAAMKQEADKLKALGVPAELIVTELKGRAIKRGDKNWFSANGKSTIGKPVTDYTTAENRRLYGGKVDYFQRKPVSSGSKSNIAGQIELAQLKEQYKLDSRDTAGIAGGKQAEFAKKLEGIIGAPVVTSDGKPKVSSVVTSKTKKEQIDAVIKAAEGKDPKVVINDVIKEQAKTHTASKQELLDGFTTMLERGNTDILTLQNDKTYLKQTGLSKKDFEDVKAAFVAKHGYAPGSVRDAASNYADDLVLMGKSVLAKGLSGTLWTMELPQDAVMNVGDLLSGTDSYSSSKDGFANGLRTRLGTVSDNAVQQLADNNPGYSKEYYDNASTAGSIVLPGAKGINKITRFVSKGVPGGSIGRAAVDKINKSKLGTKVIDESDALLANAVNKVKNTSSLLLGDSTSPLVSKFSKSLKETLKKQTSTNQMGRAFTSEKETARAIKQALKKVVSDKKAGKLKAPDLALIKKMIDRQVNLQSKGYERYIKLRKSNAPSAVPISEELQAIINSL